MTLSKTDIVGNGFGFWKTMPTAATHGDDVDPRVVEVEAVEHHLPLGPRPGDLLVHAVDAADHRRLAAARGADDRRDPPASKPTLTPVTAWLEP